MYNDGFPKTLYEQIETIFSGGIPPVIFSLYYDGGVVMSGSDVLYYLEYMYGDYKTAYDLTAVWSNYKAVHEPDFMRAYAAWSAQYDPLENYNGTETNVRQYMDGITTQTVSHGKTTTNTIKGNGMKTETQVTTFDSETPRDDTITINTGSTETADSGTTTTTTDQSVKSLTVDGESYTADKIEAETKNRHGNLGVTTSQQMITSEIDMRMNPLVKLFLDTFVSEYCWYVSNEWGCLD